MIPLLNLRLDNNWLAVFIVVSSIKISLVLLAAFASMAVLRRSSAALRHWVWSLALLGGILIPVVSLVEPAWPIPLLPQPKSWETPPGFISITAQQDRIDTPPAETAAAAAINPGQPATYAPATPAPLPPVAPAGLVEPARSSPDALPWSSLTLVGWLAGFLLVMAHWLIQLKRVRQMTRRGLLITGNAIWQHDLDALAKGLGIRQPVKLVISPEIAVPMTWGLWSPVIVLPRAALGSAWSPMRRRVVLLHELAHIARLDYLSQWFVLLSCAVNWFNPLVWRAARQALIERERASDDRVLNAGVWGIEYATHLLDLARAAVRTTPYRAIGLAMAQGSDLSQRIRGILNPNQSRHPLTRRRYISLLLALIATALPLASMQFSPGYVGRAAAQSTDTILTLAIPGKGQDILNEAITRDFEPAHPGVKVEFVDSMQLPDVTGGLDSHFAALQAYASSADVLYISGNNLGVTPHATRAGYFLDLAPLIRSDPSFQVDDLFPPMWEMYQWDNGVWGLPFSAELVLLNYSKAAFDKAGMAYPDGKWTLEDFVNAVTRLTVKDSDGHIVSSGFANSGRIFRESLWRSLLSTDLVDDSTIPNAPKLDTPEIESVLGAYHALEDQGLISSNADTAAMIVTNFQPRDFGQADRGWSLLPGNKALLLPDGFAVSAGTQHPDLAYDLVKFLTSRPELSGPIPLHKSVAGQNDQSGAKYPAGAQDLINQAFANSLNYANLRYADYLNAAHFDTTLSTQDSLREVEVRAANDVKAADNKKGTLALTVAAPVPPTLPAGKIALRFDLSTNFGTLPTKARDDQWNRVIQEFTANDPEVGLVDIRVANDSVSQAAAKSDCFYQTSNAVPGITTNSVLNLDPFLNADPSFNKDDLLPGILAAVQRDNKTYALPIDIQPLILRYDSSRFSAAGLPDPTNNWKIEDFVDALNSLKPSSAGQAPFVENNSDGAYLLVLIAAYGGLPIDYRTTPPTINFTDPATVTAIRQTLELAKNGDIRYAALGDLLHRPDIYPNQTTAIYPSTLDGFAATQKIVGIDPNSPVLFPGGHQYTALAYDVGTAYISAGAQNPEACYRFLSTLARHPELFNTMPTRRSQIASPELKATTSPEVLALYNQVEAMLNDPQTVPFPMPQKGTGSLSNFLVQHWLFEAFDSYVVAGGDLDSALKDANSYAQAFLTCVATLPVVNLDQADKSSVTIVRPYVDCAEKADSRLSPILEPLIQ